MSDPHRWKCDCEFLNPDWTADNVRDRVIRQRSAKGAKNGRAKLTEDQVREIRAMKGTMLARDIGAKFGVGEDTVYLIHQRQTWRHVE